jgi:hypothetical protein
MRTKTRVSADLYRNMCSECKEQPEALQAGDNMQHTKANKLFHWWQRECNHKRRPGLFSDHSTFFWYHQLAITSLLIAVVVLFTNSHFTFYGCSFRRVFVSLITGPGRLSFVYRSSRAALTNECRMQWMHENLLISDSLNEITNGDERMTKIHFVFMLSSGRRS